MIAIQPLVYGKTTWRKIVNSDSVDFKLQVA